MDNLFFGDHSKIVINLDNVEVITSDGANSQFLVRCVSGHTVSLTGQDARMFSSFLAKRM